MINDDNLKDRIEQIDSEEFAAAVKELRLGTIKPASKFMKRMKKNGANSKNVARMGYFDAFLMMGVMGEYIFRFELAGKYLLPLAETLLGIEIEKKS